MVLKCHQKSYWSIRNSKTDNPFQTFRTSNRRVSRIRHKNHRLFTLARGIPQEMHLRRQFSWSSPHENEIWRAFETSDRRAEETNGKVSRPRIQKYWADPANAIWRIYLSMGRIHAGLRSNCLSFFRKAERTTHERIRRLLRQNLARAQKEDEIQQGANRATLQTG